MFPGLIQAAGVSLVFFAAGTVQGVTGFGSAIVAMAFLPFLLGVKTAVSVTIVGGLVITLVMSLRLHRHLDRSLILPLMIGAVPGIGVGTYFLEGAPAGLVKLLLGLLVAGYGCWALMSSPRSRGLSPRWGYLAGLLTGVIGAAFGAGGPPTIIYSSLAGWNRAQLRATLSVFFTFTSVLAVLAHTGAGLLDTGVLGFCLAALPGLLAGVWLGMHIGDGLPETGFRRAVSILIMVMGLMLVVSAF